MTVPARIAQGVREGVDAAVTDLNDAQSTPFVSGVRGDGTVVWQYAIHSTATMPARILTVEARVEPDPAGFRGEA